MQCNAMENVFFSEHRSCHRRATTLHLTVYTSLRQVLDKKTIVVLYINYQIDALTQAGHQELS